MWRLERLVWLFVVVVGLTSCIRFFEFESSAGDGDVDGDADSDGDDDADSDADADHDADPDEAPLVRRVDILFVIDNSNSMAEEQAELARQFEPLIRELLAPTAMAGGVLPPPVSDLHVGVVTSDMGVGRGGITTCSQHGDEGRLQHENDTTTGCEPSYSAPDCLRSICPWLTHSEAYPDDAPPGAIWEDLACIGQLGTGGCGYEQPLESSLIALTVESEPDGFNAGFLREDSLLAVVYVADEDDCSASNPTMFFDPGRDDLDVPNLRCALNRDELHDVSRYYQGLSDLRTHEEHLLVAAIAGIPVDGTWTPGDSLEELANMVVIDPSTPSSLIPTCDVPDMGLAYPPVRLVELVYMFGNRGYLASICQLDWTETLRTIARRIQAQLEP